MTLSPRLGLSYLVPEQAQKHVTVNETFRLLDALVQMSAKQMDAATPPDAPEEGDIYALGSAPTGAWNGEGGKLALYQDSAWVFVTPKTGWRLFDISAKAHKTFDAGSWTADSTSDNSAGGQGNLSGTSLPDGLSLSVLEIEHSIVAGLYNDTALIIPNRALVLGVSARVTRALNAKWKLGVADGTDRYGSQIGAELDSTNLGVSNAPQAYYADTPIRISAQRNRLTQGRIKLRLYLLQFSLPTT